MSENLKESPASSADGPISGAPQNEKNRLGALIRRFVRKPQETPVSVIDGLIEQPSGEDAPVSAHERRLLLNILNLRDIRADHVMIPRADIVAIEADITQAELLSLLAEKQFSRLPVYRETLDDVLGTVHIKDITACLARGESFNVRNHISEIPIVSPAMPVIDLLKTMQESSRHLALVVDEFGGIDGLVTIGSIIESIVGEIDDEHDSEDDPRIELRPDGTLVADGRFNTQQFDGVYGPLLKDDEIESNDTLGGLVCSLAGRVPARGQVLNHSSGIVFEVLDADARRIKSLRIKNVPSPPGSA